MVVIARDKVNRDDYIGTFFLNVSDISAAGDSGMLLAQLLK